MKKIIFIAFLLVFSLVCLARDATSHATPRHEEQPLQLTIESEKQVYRIDEDIKILATLKNNSEKEMIVLWREVGGELKEANVLEVAILGDESAEALYIRPKETLEKSIVIEHAPPPWCTGKCFIKCCYYPPTILDYKHLPDQEIWMSTLTSNTITIEVVEKKSITEENNSSRSQSINDTLKHKEWSKVVEYRNNADIRFIFRNWDDILLEGPEIVTGKLVTIESQKVEDFENISNTFKGNKKLAVVIIGHRCLDYLLEEEFELKIDRVEEIIKKHGFQKVVFLGEAAMGPGFIIRE